MDKSELLRGLLELRARWDAVLDEVGLENMAEPGVAGEWSAKDLVAHVTWAVAETVVMLKARDLVGSDLWQLSQDERNAIVYEQNRHRPLDVVLAESKESHDQLIRQIVRIPEDDLLSAAWFADLPGDWPPWRVIVANAHHHYEHHEQDIRRWLAESRNLT